MRQPMRGRYQVLTTTAGPDCTPRHITTTSADIARMAADLGGQAVERDGLLVYTLAGVSFVAPMGGAR